MAIRDHGLENALVLGGFDEPVWALFQPFVYFASNIAIASSIATRSATESVLGLCTLILVCLSLAKLVAIWLPSVEREMHLTDGMTAF